nr:Radical SAM domain-containing protein [Methylocystis sp. SC2]
MNKPQSAPLREAIAGVPGRYWERLADGRIQCDLCPRYCKLHDGQRGLCFVRARRGDEILLTTYGRSSGFCIDPIEKKPINHFLPGTPALSFGTAGCNLACKFCQNWDISKARSFDRLQSEASPEAIVSAAKATGSRAIAYTYNNPVIFLEYAVDVARAARAQDIKNVAVTAGYISEKAREELFSAIDAANIDLKAFTEGFYRQLCSAELGPVLDTLEYVKRETKVWLEITTLLIPGCNDAPSEIAALSEWVVSRLGPDVPLHFSAFHADTDEAGHAFQYEAGHLFRSEAGRGSDLMSATSVALPQIDLDDVSRFERGQAGWFFAAGDRRLRRLSPESSIREALWMTRSRMASAIVGMRSCHARSTGI